MIYILNIKLVTGENLNVGTLVGSLIKDSAVFQTYFIIINKHSLSHPVTKKIQ